MGTYNNYGSTQIKVGDLGCIYFEIGDEAKIPDGIYVDHNSAIVIKNGIFIAEFDNIISKWGDIIKCSSVIDEFDDVKKAIEKAVDVKKTIEKAVKKIKNN